MALPRNSRTGQYSRPTWEYCLRPGHWTETCFTRAADARQEAILRRVIVESRMEGQPHHRSPQHPHAPFRDSSPQQYYQDEQPRHHWYWTSPSREGEQRGWSVKYTEKISSLPDDDVGDKETDDLEGHGRHTDTETLEGRGEEGRGDGKKGEEGRG
ncbi:hypothetical protein E2C01_012824 [Portunus trituberculatus]|uniref:Uncharacterized protein n=1 Tax=Portunus trituberculatus TaxID=210409 RepID=A0A5B7DF43_PORTR|nr:hypothetical protein [Portunus trituberculatus]